MTDFALPKLAKCTNRKIGVKSHPTAGDPSEWISRGCSEPDAEPCTFDFIVHWETGAIREIWTKTIVTPAAVAQRNQAGPLSGEFDHCDDLHGGNLSRVGDFARKHGVTARHWAIPDDVAWDQPPSAGNPAWAFELGIERMWTVADVSQLIEGLRGKTVPIGRGGLFYGTSSLECYLSTSRWIWPGDVDALQLKPDGTPTIIWEFKKHNLEADIRQQTVATYLARDRMKYESFSALQKAFGGNPNVVVLTYPTRSSHRHVKLELIANEAGRNRVAASKVLELPDAPDDTWCRELVACALGLGGET